MIARMNRRTIRKFNRAKEKMKLAKFDELNVLRTVRGLYEELDKDTRDFLLALALAVYSETKPRGKEKPDKKWLLSLLDEPDPTTMYIYTTEVVRKREYLEESLLAEALKGGSSSSDTVIDTQTRKAMSYWARMTAQYADIVTGEAMLKAFRDAGVKRVRWYTREDERVCKVCGKRHGRIYPINRLPARPHWGCRCWWEPVF